MNLKSENEHICVLVEPKGMNLFGYKDLTSQNGKKYRTILGIPKRSGSSVNQANLYPKEEWSVKEARAHCKKHGGKFEGAMIQKASSMLLSILGKGKE